MKKTIRLLVVDLDNTLYDWVTSFVPSFYAMVDVACGILSADKEKLLDELQIVHQKYHNSEHPFALLETEIVRRRYPDSTPYERMLLLEEAFRAFNKMREQNLMLYPGVGDTIHLIKATGCLIVGYTEARVENSLHRLKLLKLIQEINYLYAPSSKLNGHPNPARPKMRL